jgi:hypothetical protein
MFTGYFFLFFLNVYAVLGVVSQYQEYSSTPRPIEFELGPVAKAKSDQTQICVTSSGEGKGMLKTAKREESSYLEWSCNDPANADSNNSANSASTATTGTNKSSNGTTTKEHETSKKSKPSNQLTPNTKSWLKKKLRGQNDKDFDNINTKYLPKLVVTHVKDTECSNELKGTNTFCVYTVISLQK